MKFQKLSVLMGLSGIRLRCCLSERCQKTHELECVEIENVLFHDMQGQWCQIPVPCEILGNACQLLTILTPVLKHLHKSTLCIDHVLECN
jgi:hypothetical protein